MSLSVLPIALIVPPLNLLPIAVAGLVLLPRHPRTGAAVSALAVAGLLLLALPAVSGGLLVALERNLPLLPPAGDPPQAIVILAAELVDRLGTPTAEPGPLTLERERAGAALARRTALPVLVTGGPMPHSTDSLAAVMAHSLADDFRIPVRWAEPRAMDTWENAANSAAMLRSQNIHSIYLVTHAWHMRRALIAFADTGLTVTAAPVRLDPPPSPVVADFIPRAASWLASYYAIHEWIGCAEYLWLRSRRAGT